MAATMYSLGTWFVSGICVWIPYIKETMMMMMMMIIRIMKSISFLNFDLLTRQAKANNTGSTLI
jgi:hypothetical protein